jgi:hypothetical protein
VVDMKNTQISNGDPAMTSHFQLGNIFLSVTLAISCSDSKFASSERAPKSAKSDKPTLEAEATQSSGESATVVNHEPVPTAELDAPKVVPPVPLKDCVDPLARFDLYYVCGLPKVAQGVFSGSKTFTLPLDAIDIKYEISKVGVDDYAPKVHIGEKIAGNLLPIPDEKLAKAHDIPVKIDLTGKLKAGSNTFNYSFMDGYGTCAQLFLEIRGTYKAAVCNSTINPAAP